MPVWRGVGPLFLSTHSSLTINWWDFLSLSSFGSSKPRFLFLLPVLFAFSVTHTFTFTFFSNIRHVLLFSHFHYLLVCLLLPRRRIFCLFPSQTPLIICRPFWQLDDTSSFFLFVFLYSSACVAALKVAIEAAVLS